MWGSFRVILMEQNVCCRLLVTWSQSRRSGMAGALRSVRMNKGNASSFFLLGLGFWLLPSLAPDLFPRNGIDGSSARALWIQVMGLVHTALGAGFLLQSSVVPRFTRWLATEPSVAPVFSETSTARPLPAAIGAFSE